MKMMPPDVISHENQLQHLFIPRQPETGSEITAEELNDHYARVSTDPHYAPPALRSTAYNKREDFTEAEIFYALDRLRPTSEGADRLPSWFLKTVAPVCSSVLPHLINRSLGSAHVPEQWKLAVITPVPKVPKPTAPTDYRPISVVPVLSRMVERLISGSICIEPFRSPRCAKTLPTNSRSARRVPPLQRS